jgi:hypothetical protein
MFILFSSSRMLFHTFYWFQGPYIEKTTTRLHKVVGDDNVLVVKFSDISEHTNASDNLATCRDAYTHIFEDGIMLGLRRYRFFSKFLSLGMSIHLDLFTMVDSVVGIKFFTLQILYGNA